MMAGLLPDRRNTPPTAQTGGVPTSGAKRPRFEEPDWLSRAQRAFAASTSYIDTNYRKQWEDSIRAFNNQHPSESKYNAPAYDKRSRIFRPKTRAIIRKNEAAAAAAFFSNMDTTTVQPNDPNNLAEVASSEIMKQLLQYRLTKTIPWYQIVLGGLQDAQTTGAAAAHVHWEYEEKSPEDIAEEAIEQVEEAEKPETPETPEGSESEYPTQTALPENAMMATAEGGLAERPEAPKVEAVIVVQEKPVVVKDAPAVDLIPLENCRFDPGASWIDPVNTSPYFIHLIPMYALDVKEKMRAGTWKKMGNEELLAATEISPDSTRIARNKNKDDPYATAIRDVTDYEIIWVQRHIHRHRGEDLEFYTLGDIALLTDPQPLKKNVFTGKRPYVLGVCNLETHKAIPSPIPSLVKGLQDETNEVANQRLDNVKFVLNKKWFVKRGKEADVNGLLRNVPGGVVMLDDPEGDVREITWPDVTSSAFEEHRTLSMEMDELLGNFNPVGLMTGGAMNAPVRNMAMLSNNQGTLTEYLIRTYVETFVQPILRMLMLMEQKYETDQVIIGLAGKRAQLHQKFGIDRVTDELLEKELTLTVNVGMGATDPSAKLQKFIAGVTAYMTIVSRPVPGLNTGEVGKEIFSHMGYSDGARFISTDNPQVIQLQQQVQQLMQVNAQLQQRVKDKQTGHMVSLQKTRETNQTAIAQTQIKEEGQNRRSLATHMRALMEAGEKLKK
jgi:hypothetical protein